MSRRLPVALAVVLAAAIARGDDILLVPKSTVPNAIGGKLKGTIQSETAAEVRVAINGKEVAVPVDQIEDIEYTGMPQSYTIARVREANNTLAQAAESYQKAVGEAGKSPLIARDAQFGRARVLATLAQADPRRAPEALSALDGFLKANPNVRQTGPALELVAKLALRREEFDRADKAAADLGRIARMKDRADVLKARILAARGKHKEAVAALDSIIAGAPDGSARRREAQLAKAESLAGLGQFDEAETLAKAVIRAAGAEDAEAQALANNTLGDCLKAANKPKEALLAYLRTDILYPRDKEQHARALSEVVRLFRRLKQDDRAEEALARLKQDFPSSPYTAALASPGR
ncbi:MAG TPA: tetratricopeptide repeat protein [Isosphaeraceae bacterium]|jgi:tetratricopeptide (TPR) repeat protein|nr:tetratricopeptide repeat protein [Isosphaeraceae bacterium]